MPVQNQAMLMNLSVSKWTTRRFDRKATEAVHVQHNAKDAGRYNKLLIDSDALKPINQAEAKLRDIHYRLTLPWGDNGDRLLPSKLYFEYTKQMRDARQAFEQAVQSFLPTYPQLKADASKRLGALYDPNDYPCTNAIAAKFSVRIEPAPVPDANDFRVDVGREDQEQIRRDITQSVAARQAEAVKDCYARVRELCERYSRTLRAKTPRIFDTMVTDAAELATLLPALNVAEDPTLNSIAEDLKKLAETSADRLRSGQWRRQECADLAEATLRKVPAE
jgi:hypothetical protein